MSGSVGILADPHGLTGVTPIGQTCLPAGKMNKLY
jgi:hypothetical protein